MKPKIYSDDMPLRAYRLALLGLTDEEIADAFGVSVEALDKWKQKYPEFKKHLKAGKQEADSHVAESLFNSARGFVVPEEKVFCNTVAGEVQVTRVQTEKYYPPNITATKFWLKNRNKEIWRDVQNLEHSGQISRPHELDKTKMDLSDFTDEELSLLESIQVKLDKKLKDE